MTTSEHLEPVQCERCGLAHATRLGGPSCRGHRRDGAPCTNPPMAGQRVCRMHGGSSPGARERAAERQQEAEAGRVLARIWNRDAAPVTNAVQGLQRLAGQLEHAADALGSRLEDGQLDAVTAAAWLRVVRELRTALSEMERLGIAERHAEIEASKVRVIAVAVGRVFEALGLSADDRSRGVSLLLAELRSLPAPEDPDGSGGEAA